MQQSEIVGTKPNNFYLDEDGTIRDVNNLDFLGHWFKVDQTTYIVPIKKLDINLIKKEKNE